MSRACPGSPRCLFTGLELGFSDAPPQRVSSTPSSFRRLADHVIARDPATRRSVPCCGLPASGILQHPCAATGGPPHADRPRSCRQTRRVRSHTHSGSGGRFGNELDGGEDDVCASRVPRTRLAPVRRCAVRAVRLARCGAVSDGEDGSTAHGDCHHRFALAARGFLQNRSKPFSLAVDAARARGHST